MTIRTSATTPLPLGIASVDQALGPLDRGTVWAFVGMRGVGITQLMCRCARSASADHLRVAIANGHLPERVIRSRLGDDAGRVTVQPWFGLPGGGPSPWGDSTLDGSDLIIYDTVDEMFPARTSDRAGRHAWRSALRDVRATTRSTRTATLITARLAPTGTGLRAVRAAWRTHPVHEAVMDAADVVVTVIDGPGPAELTLLSESRLGHDRSAVTSIRALFDLGEPR